MPKIRNTQGTLIYLKIIKSISLAYCEFGVSNGERLENAIFSLHFLRIWRQWLIKNKISLKHFITNNAYEGIEMNLVLLVHLLETNQLHLIPIISSQNCEKFFALFRTYTGMESMVANCSIKGFISRVNRIKIEEFLMSSFKDRLIFPKLDSRSLKFFEAPKQLSQAVIQSIIFKAKMNASHEAQKFGMDCEVEYIFDHWGSNFQPNEVLEENEATEDEEESEDFLGIENDEISLDLIESDDFDTVKFITVENIELTDEISSKLLI